MNPTSPQSPNDQLQALQKQIEAQQLKIEQIYKSVESTRKMILWTGIITAALIILPAIGLVFAIPSFLNQYSQMQTLLQ